MIVIDDNNAPISLEILDPVDAFILNSPGGLYMVSQGTDSLPCPSGKILATNLTTGQVYAFNPDTQVYRADVQIAVIC